SASCWSLPQRSRRRRCGRNVIEWLCKHETTSSQRAPFLDSSLQCSDLTGGGGTKALLTKSGKDLFGRPIGFRLGPTHPYRPRGFKGILPRAPVPRRLGSFRCVGRTSPSRHACARLFRKRSRSASRCGST